MFDDVDDDDDDDRIFTVINIYYCCCTDSQEKTLSPPKTQCLQNPSDKKYYAFLLFYNISEHIGCMRLRKVYTIVCTIFAFISHAPLLQRYLTSHL